MQDFSQKKQFTLVAFGAHADPFDMPHQADGALAKYTKRGPQGSMTAAAHEPEGTEEVKAITRHMYLGAKQCLLNAEIIRRLKPQQKRIKLRHDYPEHDYSERRQLVP